MAARNTSSDVKVIVETSIADVTTPFIDNAALIVDEELADQGYSDDRLKMIELYLAAHFVALTEERGALLESKTGNSMEVYGGNFSEGLKLTRYGQQAIALDKKGVLAAISTPKLKALFRVV